MDAAAADPPTRWCSTRSLVQIRMTGVPLAPMLLAPPGSREPPLASRAVSGAAPRMFSPRTTAPPPCGPGHPVPLPAPVRAATRSTTPRQCRRLRRSGEEDPAGRVARAGDPPHGTLDDVHIAVAARRPHTSRQRANPRRGFPAGVRSLPWGCRFSLERETGFEPATLCMASKCSTPELLPLGSDRWCGRRDSNSHGLRPPAPKADASAIPPRPPEDAARADYTGAPGAAQGLRPGGPPPGAARARAGRAAARARPPESRAGRPRPGWSAATAWSCPR